MKIDTNYLPKETAINLRTSDDLRKNLGIKGLIYTVVICSLYPERFNQSLVTALSKVVNEASDDWDEHINAVAFAYRINVQATTRKSPFKLLYGVNARLPQQLKDDGCEYSWATDDATAEAILRRAETIADVLQQKRKSAQKNITAA